jgi:hypothetical protein
MAPGGAEFSFNFIGVRPRIGSWTGATNMASVLTGQTHLLNSWLPAKSSSQTIPHHKRLCGRLHEVRLVGDDWLEGQCGTPVALNTAPLLNQLQLQLIHSPAKMGQKKLPDAARCRQTDYRAPQYILHLGCRVDPKVAGALGYLLSHA